MRHPAVRNLHMLNNDTTPDDAPVYTHRLKYADEKAEVVPEIVLSKSFTRRRTWKQAKALSQSQEFRIQCAEDGVDYEEVLNLKSYSRADKCSNPQFLRAENTKGQVKQVKRACEMNNPDDCPECAEWKQKVRRVQILDVLESGGMNIALFTLTAPSFGSVHRATWTKKDEYRARKMDPDELADMKDATQAGRDGSRCDCRKHHSYSDPEVGTPTGRYNYLAEAMWSRNLPALMKSTEKKLKDHAANFGIPKLSIFGVYERQKRGALHVHLLLAVPNDPEGFTKLVEDLTPGQGKWKQPTAAISPRDVAAYAVATSYVAADHDMKAALPATVAHDALTALPRDENGNPQTTWGSVRDIRVLEPDPVEGDTTAPAEPTETPEDPTAAPEEAAAPKPFDPDAVDLVTFSRSASYLAKYLTKNNSAFSPEALTRVGAESKPLRAHYNRLRRAALYLLVEQRLRAAQTKERERYIERLLKDPTQYINVLKSRTGKQYLILRPIPTAGYTPELEAYVSAYTAQTRRLAEAPYLPTALGFWVVHHLRNRKIGAVDLQLLIEKTTLPGQKTNPYELLATKVTKHRVVGTEEDMDGRTRNVLEPVERHGGQDPNQPPLNDTTRNMSNEQFLPLRYLAMMLNRMASNAGFTGALVTAHNWTTLTQLKAARVAWYLSQHPEEEQETWKWEPWSDAREFASQIIKARITRDLAEKAAKERDTSTSAQVRYTEPPPGSESETPPLFHLDENQKT
jgi:hypothetical protein